jgi:hypothetical protein
MRWRTSTEVTLRLPRSISETSDWARPTRSPSFVWLSPASFRYSRKTAPPVPAGDRRDQPRMRPQVLEPTSHIPNIGRRYAAVTWEESHFSRRVVRHTTPVASVG